MTFDLTFTKTGQQQIAKFSSKNGGCPPEGRYVQDEYITNLGQKVWFDIDDDPNTGWKGRAVYSSTGADTVWHSEGGLAVENGQYKSVSKPILVKFQIRPDPLAR